MTKTPFSNDTNEKNQSHNHDNDTHQEANKNNKPITTLKPLTASSSLAKKNKQKQGHHNNYHALAQKRNFQDLFTSKHWVRYITSLFIVLGFVVYIFIGACSTLFHATKNIEYINILFFTINIGLLGLINYEVLNFFRNINFSLGLKIFSYLLILLLYFWPFTFNFHQNYQFFFYDKFQMSWLKWYVNLFILLGFFGAYLSFALFSKDITLKEALVIFAISLFFTFFIKALTIFSLNKINYGFSFLVWIVIIVTLTDSFAFLGGIIYGRHCLAPRISPNKTTEGAITGLLMGSTTGIAYSFGTFFSADAGNIARDWIVLDAEFNATGARVVIYILLSFFLSALAILSDLAFSWIKRRYNVKDFSNLLPGHGGIIDRVDALSVVSVVMFLILTLFIAS